MRCCESTTKPLGHFYNNGHFDYRRANPCVTDLGWRQLTMKRHRLSWGSKIPALDHYRATKFPF